MTQINKPCDNSIIDCQRRQRGAVTVEAAIILPLLMIITLGSTDFAQYINSSQLTSNASRVGARIASRDQTESISQVEAAIRNYFYNAFSQLAPATLDPAIIVNVTLSDGSPVVNGDLTSVQSGDQITVTVVFDFEKVRWIKGLDYWESSPNESITIARRD